MTDGNPISDVSVTVKGKKQGTIADKNGRFSIKANQKDILVFSSVSYATKEVKVESRGNEYRIATGNKAHGIIDYGWKS